MREDSKRLAFEFIAGKVSTYKILADQLKRGGSKASPIAVGQALKRNPFAPVVPCHRVVNSNLSLGGFYGIKGNPKKEEMLLEEGLMIESGKIVGKDSLHYF